MYDDYTRDQSVVTSRFKTIEITPELESHLDKDAYSGVLVYTDTTDTFDTFSFTEDGEIKTAGDIITQINKNAVHTNQQFHTVLDTYSNNDLIVIQYVSSDGDVAERTVRLTEEGFQEVDETQEREYFGKESSEIEFDRTKNTDFTLKQQLLRYFILFLFTIILILLIGGSIIQIVNLVLENFGITDLISNLNG